MAKALDLYTCAEAIGVAPETLRKQRRTWVRTVGFPPSINLTRRLAWDAEAVEAWKQRRVSVLGRGDGGLADTGLAEYPANDDRRAHQAAKHRHGVSAARIHHDHAAALAALQRGLR